MQYQSNIIDAIVFLNYASRLIMSPNVLAKLELLMLIGLECELRPGDFC